jgi:ferredoxin
MSSEEHLDPIRERARWAGAVDGRGRPLQRLGRAPVVVGLVCDGEPLLETLAAVGAAEPDRVLRGLAAAGLLAGAGRLLLAVDAEAGALEPLRRRARETRVEVVAIPARSPLDPGSLLCDLAEALGANGPGPAGLAHAHCLDAVALVDLALAAEGQVPRRRTLTVAGTLRRPAILEAALGTSFAELVAACGGSPDPGWVGFEDGLLGGRRIEPRESVELTTRGLIVLPHDHPLVERGCAPLADELGRVASACALCRVCSELCPVRLNGGPLDPQRLILALARGARWSEDETWLLGARACTGCGVCSAACPAALRPARIVRELASRLPREAEREHPPLVPDRDRPGRRLSVARLADALGLHPLRRPLARRVGHLIPEQVSYALRSGGLTRVPVVERGASVRIGETLALAPAGALEGDCRSAVSGVVIRVDPDDGIVVATR